MKIAVLMGGISDERKVSIESGRMVLRHLATRGFRVRPVVIDADRSFRLGRTVQGSEDLERFDHDRGLLDDSPLLVGRFDPLAGAAALVEWSVDLAFLALHGPGGEDGAIQGFLDWAGIPYTGAGVAASALAMNKCAFKALMVDQGIPTAMHLSFTIEEWKRDPQGVVDRGLRGPGLPDVVKVSGSGSSYGVFVVHRESDLLPALAGAFAADPFVLWERYVPGVELACALLGDHRAARIRDFPIVEIVPRKAAFFDLASKYEPGGADEIVPARIPPEAARTLVEISTRIHRLIGCTGMSRTDAILSPDGKLAILETNTIPGLTAASLYPKAAAGAGLDFGELVEAIARSALGGDAGKVDLDVRS